MLQLKTASVFFSKVFRFCSHTNSYLKASFSVNLCLLTLWQLSWTLTKIYHIRAKWYLKYLKPFEYRSGIQIPFKKSTNWQLDRFVPNEYPTSKLFESPLFFQDLCDTLRANPGVTIHVIFPPMSTETFGVEHRSSMHEATQVNCRQWMHLEGVRPPKDPSITWIKITRRVKISLNIAARYIDRVPYFH